MKESEFDREKAKAFLAEKKRVAEEHLELERKRLLEKTLTVLKEEFAGETVEVFLVGSILVPYTFHAHSDIDIVVKNFQGDRFDLWSKLEGILGRQVEVIRFEQCGFQDYVESRGLKVN